MPKDLEHHQRGEQPQQRIADALHDRVAALKEEGTLTPP
jgi:hypothetical protein